MDRVVLVVRAGQTTTRELRQAQDLLRRADARVLGVVVNEAHPRDMHYYTRQYAKYYRVADEKPDKKPTASPPAEKKM
jgi:Mrp family chromosome partitioning ATPase